MIKNIVSNIFSRQRPDDLLTDVPFIERFTFDEIHAKEREALGCEVGPLSALCLSGGGIRSAAFCLGVIQAFAKAERLREFHYLSTVSGGGYVGGFLTACIANRNQLQSDQFPIDIVASVEAKICAFPSTEIDNLRKYTNYLTPNPGFASADTWAGITLWLRNTFVNWTVFLPCFLILTLTPIFYFSVLCMMAAMRSESGQYLGVILGTVALTCLHFALCNAIVQVPSHQHPDPNTPNPTIDKPGLSGSEVFWQILIFAITWSLLAPLAVAPTLGLPEGGIDAAKALSEIGPSSTDFAIWKGLLLMPAGNLAVSLFAFLVAEWKVSRTFTDEVRKSAEQKIKDMRKGKGELSGSERWFYEHRKAFRVNRTAWAIVSVLSSAMLLLGLWLAAGKSAVWVALFGPLWIILAETLRISLYVALRQRALRADLDREWLARLSGVQLGYALALCALGVTVLLLPMLIHQIDRPKLWASLVGGGLLSGPLTAWIGHSAKTVFLENGAEGKTPGFFRIEWLLYAGIIAFAITLLTIYGWTARSIVLLAEDLPHGVLRILIPLSSLVILGALGYAIKTIVWPLTTSKIPNDKVGPQSAKITICGLMLLGTILAVLTLWFIYTIYQQSSALTSPCDLQFFIAALACLVLAGILAGLALWLSRTIDLNNFSMHAVYRNRLVRAFLGTARNPKLRKEDQYTNFDPCDDLRVADAFDRRQRKRLFPVINVALNRTSGKDTARAERKAEPFTITPLHCGSASYQRKIDGRLEKTGEYISTEKFAGKHRETGPLDESKGITLGTAMALSGAAVSPNMGYHSSPLVAFLMTLFNVRLGAWTPNPAFPIRDPDDLLMRRKPRRSGLPTLLAELAGRSDDRGEFVYLSDGGHVDNLGLYEMLQRRCRSIVVVDAGQDENYAYFDLGSTLRRARIDMGIELHFVRTIGTRNKTLPDEGAYAEFTYPPKNELVGERQEDDRRGRLVVLKSWLPADAPTDLRAYQADRQAFPHESTGNQFFKESDFESYRRLGEYIAQTMIEKARKVRPPKRDDADPIAALFEGLGRLATAKPAEGIT